MLRDETLASFILEQDVDSSDKVVTISSNQLKEMKAKWRVLQSLNSDMQEALKKSEAEVQTLVRELLAVQRTKKCLEQEKNVFKDLMVEVDDLKLILMNYQNAECKARECKKKLEREYLQMEQEVDRLSCKNSVLEEENRLLRDEVTRLKQQVVKLESDLDAKNLELEEKDKFVQERDAVIGEMVMTLRQYTSTKEALNSKVQDLQVQLEEAHQELTIRCIEDSSLNNNSEANGRIMNEVIQSRMETELELAHLKKERQTYLCLRFPLNMVIQIVWYCFSVGIFLLLMFVVMRRHYPEKPMCDLWTDFSSGTANVINDIVRSILKWRDSWVGPL